jgi:HEAT repeat protein
MSISRKHAMVGIAAVIVLFSVVLLFSFSERRDEEGEPVTGKTLSSKRPDGRVSATPPPSRGTATKPKVEGQQPKAFEEGAPSLLETVLSSIERNKKPAGDTEKVAVEMRTPSEIKAMLEEAETLEEMAEKAVKIVQSGVKSDILALFAAIEDAADEEDRDTLARSLQGLETPEVGPDLVDFLLRNVDDPIIAEEARNALARIIAPEDIGQIVQVIPSDPEQEAARFYLLSALSQINNPASVEALTALCETTKDQDVQTAASSALSAIGTPEAVSSLISLVEGLEVEDASDPLAQALMSSANKDSRELLEQESLTTVNPVVQDAAAAALASLNEQSMAEAEAQEGFPAEREDRQ